MTGLNAGTSEEKTLLAYLLHADHNSRQVAVARQENEGGVGFARLNRRCGGNVAVLWYAVLVWRVAFRAGQLFREVREGCCATVLLM